MDCRGSLGLKGYMGLRLGYCEEMTHGLDDGQKKRQRNGSQDSLGLFGLDVGLHVGA